MLQNTLGYSIYMIHFTKKQEFAERLKFGVVGSKLSLKTSFKY